MPGRRKIAIQRLSNLYGTGIGKCRSQTPKTGCRKAMLRAPIVTFRGFARNPARVGFRRQHKSCRVRRRSVPRPEPPAGIAANGPFHRYEKRPAGTDVRLSDCLSDRGLNFLNVLAGELPVDGDCDAAPVIGGLNPNHYRVHLPRRSMQAPRQDASIETAYVTHRWPRRNSANVIGKRHFGFNAACPLRSSIDFGAASAHAQSAEAISARTSVSL
jgi:hypothetical protein